MSDSAASKSDDLVVRNPVEKDTGDFAGSPPMDKWQQELTADRDKAMGSLLNQIIPKADSGSPSSSGQGTETGTLQKILKNNERENGGSNDDKNAVKPNVKEPTDRGNGNGNEVIKNGERLIKENGAINSIEKFLKPDGVKELPTGDHLVREDGKETLFTPNGDKITVNPDGTFKVKGDVKSVETSKDGVTTIKLGDGSEVKIDKEGILSVQRGNQAVSFPRWNQKHGSGDSHPNPPKPSPKPWPDGGNKPPRGGDESPKPAPRPWPGGGESLPPNREKLPPKEMPKPTKPEESLPPIRIYDNKKK